MNEIRRPWPVQYIDSHSHLADPRLDSPEDQLRRDWLTRAAAKGITHHLQGGVGPEDWQRQLHLQQQFPQTLPVFGLHPYWVAAHSDDECENALDLLAQLQGQCLAIGEMGLDLRPHIAGESRDRQITCFESQLELCAAANKPAVLHIVRAFEEAEKILQIWGVPPRGGFVHSFNGSAKEAEAYLALGLMISVGGPIARAKNERLRQAVRVTPMECLLLETDAPDQPGDQFHGGLNPSESLWGVAQAVATIKGLEAEEILDISSQNLRKLLQLQGL